MEATLRSGAKMPRIGIGTYKLKGEHCYNAVVSALQNGYRLIDTASMYKNELEIGRAIKDSGIPREEVFIASKLWANDHKPDRLRKSFRASLEALGTDYLDLYIMHYPFSLENAENYPEGDMQLSYIPSHKVWKHLEALVDEGLVKDIGISNWPAALVLETMSYSRIKPSVVQLEIHPYNTQEKLVGFCQRQGIVVTGFGSLGGVEYGHVHDATPLLQHPLIREVAQKHSKSTGQVLLNWSLARGLCIIPRSRCQERQIMNMQSKDFTLEQEDLDKISSLNQNLRFYGAKFYEQIEFPLFS